MTDKLEQREEPTFTDAEMFNAEARSTRRFRSFLIPLGSFVFLIIFVVLLNYFLSHIDL